MVGFKKTAAFVFGLAFSICAMGEDGGRYQNNYVCNYAKDEIVRFKKTLKKFGKSKERIGINVPFDFSINRWIEKEIRVNGLDGREHVVATRYQFVDVDNDGKDEWIGTRYEQAGPNAEGESIKINKNYNPEKTGLKIELDVLKSGKMYGFRDIPLKYENGEDVVGSPFHVFFFEFENKIYTLFVLHHGGNNVDEDGFVVSSIGVDLRINQICYLGKI